MFIGRAGLFPLCSPMINNDLLLVWEYKPIIHRAIPSGSHLGPTNSTPIDVVWKTLDFRRLWFSHNLNATHTGILTSDNSSLPYEMAFAVVGTLPYPPLDMKLSNGAPASVTVLIPVHFRRQIFIPVSCYAFFKGWLLLSQPPGCLKNSTSFN